MSFLNLNSKTSADTQQYTGPLPDYLGRYIDDCLSSASCSRIVPRYPSLHHWGNRLTTSVFYKPTNSHSYLLYCPSIPIILRGPSLSLSSFVVATFAAKIRIFKSKCSQIFSLLHLSTLPYLRPPTFPIKKLL